MQAASRTNLVFGRVLVRPYAAAGTHWEILATALCLTALGLVFLGDVLTPDNVLAGLALLPLLAAVWLLSSRPATLVVLVAGLLFGVVAILETANELTVLSLALAAFLTAVVVRRYANSLASPFISKRHLRPTVPSSAAPAPLAAINSSRDLRSLTRRELDVTRLAAEGYTATEIGERLHIGRRTVETHLASTYTKLGIRTRSQLIRLASHLGVL